MAKRQAYSFVEKKYSSNSVVSAVLSTGSVLVLLILLFVSFLMKGSVGAWIGALGFTGIVMAFAGLRYGFLGFKDECKLVFHCLYRARKYVMGGRPWNRKMKRKCM